MTLGEKIRELRTKKGYSLRKLSKIVGSASHSYIAAIERGENNPSLNILSDIANALGVSTAYLLDIYDKEKSGNEKFKIDEHSGEISKEEMISVPIVGDVAAGKPILADEHIEGYRQMPAKDINGECFLLKIKGDSMINAGIHENDLVLIRQQAKVETGDIAAVMIDNENATLKRVYFHDNSVLLQSENSKYKPMNINNERVKIIGKAIEVIHKL